MANPLNEALKLKFGPEITAKIDVLVSALADSDPLIKYSADSYKEIFLSVEKDRAAKILFIIEELIKTSYFAAAFLIEKLPILDFYKLTDDVLLFINAYKHYSARYLSYYLGSDRLKSPDLNYVLSNIELEYYRTLLKAVIDKTDSLQILAAPILREAIQISKFVKTREIGKFLDLVIKMHQLFPHAVTEEILKNLDKILAVTTLQKFYQKLALQKVKDEDFMRILANNPASVMRHSIKKIKNGRNIKYKILKNNLPGEIIHYPDLAEDKYFSALLLNWPNYSLNLRQNILDQLASKNFKEELITNPAIGAKLKTINDNTNHRWFSEWYFAGAEIEPKYIFQEIYKTFGPNNYYKDRRDKIFKDKSELFRILEQEPSNPHILELIQYLSPICIDENTRQQLDRLKGVALGEKLAIINHYSANNILIKAWERNPWVDYGRSDELFACTSTGDYADIYGPSYLSDCNITNLDIINNSHRIGRIHLSLLNNKTLLVDRVEGSERLLRGEKRLNIIFNSILAYAQFTGQKKVIFNATQFFNNTPKKFISFLSQQMAKESFYAERLIEDGTVRETMRYPLNSYLESLGTRNKGIVHGYQVNL